MPLKDGERRGGGVWGSGVWQKSTLWSSRTVLCGWAGKKHQMEWLDRPVSYERSHSKWPMRSLSGWYTSPGPSLSCCCGECLDVQGGKEKRRALWDHHRGQQEPRCQHKQILGMEALIMAMVKTRAVAPGEPEVISLQWSKGPDSAQCGITGLQRHCQGKILDKGGNPEESRRKRFRLLQFPRQREQCAFNLEVTSVVFLKLVRPGRHLNTLKINNSYEARN